MRSSIARSLVASRFHPTFGIHHDSQLNAFNLADDLIEPYRAIVDVAAHENIGSNVQLSKSERKSISHVLHNACIIIRGTAAVTVNSSNRKYGGDNRMRLLVILSPTDKWGTKTEYTKLRKFLQRDGYIRIAPEVYMRIVQNRKASEKHYRRIDEVAPKTEVVFLLVSFFVGMLKKC